MESFLKFDNKVLSVKMIETWHGIVPCISIRTLKIEKLYPECLESEKVCIMTSWGNLIDIHCYDDISLGFIDLDQVITLLMDCITAPQLFSDKSAYDDFALKAKYFVGHYASRGITFVPSLSNELIFGNSCVNCLYPLLAEKGNEQRNKITEIPAKITTKTKLINYFVFDVTHNLIKIGVTEDLQKRINSFKTSNPGELKLLKAISGGYSEEKELHSRFSHLRVTGEWFRASAEIFDYIASL